MDKKDLFEKNLLALMRIDPSLCARLSKAETTRNRYKFSEAASGEIIPLWIDSFGAAHPLHSTVDPRREARRLFEISGDDRFVILLGLGGGYYAEAALAQNSTSLLCVIDYDIHSIAELLCQRDYTKIFNDPRFHILVDPEVSFIDTYILGIYQPMLYGGIHTMPLRARVSGDNKNFTQARETIENVVRKISRDYSVQAYFGTRWFANVIRNLKRAEKNDSPLPAVKRAAITAAGPSLNFQIKEIRERRNDFFLIAADTSLPSLLSEHIIPDAVVSIDCQHISYYHFMVGIPGETLLFMDLAGPPLVASRTEKLRFFSGGHPLTAYVSGAWRSLPEVDTSGANVTYAAVSLAEKLGAESAELYGADFSYPMGNSYARGSYIHPLFQYRHKRLAPMESQYSAFLYRGTLNKITTPRGWYYESPSLTFYREKLEEKCETMKMKLIPREGRGAAIHIPLRSGIRPQSGLNIFNSGICRMKAEEFLSAYRDDISSLPVPAKKAWFFESLRDREKMIFTTLLPAAAALKHRHPEFNTGELINETRAYCVREIEKVLNAAP